MRKKAAFGWLSFLFQYYEFIRVIPSFLVRVIIMSFTSDNKRKPASPDEAKKAQTNAATSNQVGNSERDKTTTVFNSMLDKNLITVDVYKEDLGKTINNLYDFSTTMSFGALGDMLQGGLNMVQKVTGVLKEASKIKEAIKSGNYMDALNALAPGAKSALQKAGLDTASVDKFMGVAQIAVNVGGVIKDIKSGDYDVLTGLNALAKSLTGTELGIITDIQAMVGAVSTITTEFTKAGIELASSWNDLTNQKGHDYSQQVFHNTFTEWSKSGDYKTLQAAINQMNPDDVEKVSGNVSASLLKYFSLNSVFNASKTTQEAVKDAMDTIYLLRGENSLWVPRGALRMGLGFVLLGDCSEDFKAAVKTVYAEGFYFAPTDTVPPVGTKPVQLPYKDKNNEVLLSLINLLPLGNPKQELSSMFSGVEVNANKNTSNYVSPFDFERNS